MENYAAFWRSASRMARTLLVALLFVFGAAPSFAQTADTATFAPAPHQVGRFFRASAPYDFSDHTGFVSLFDGRTLEGWDADPNVWRVENGAMVAEIPSDTHPNNNYIIYRRARPRDFDLKLEIRALSGGTGIQYRSQTGQHWVWPSPGAGAPDPDHMLTGPQADYWAGSSQSGYTGQVYIENINTPQRIVAWRGEVTQSAPGAAPRIVAGIGDNTALGQRVHTDGGWNQYEIIARGGVMMHIINGQLMAVHIDDDPRSANRRAGYIGIEAEVSPARIEVRDIWLRTLPSR